MSVKKGQFFLLGAFFLVLMFYIGISVFYAPSYTTQGIGEDVSNLFKNIENEYPRAFNFGLNASSPVQTLVDFTGFADSMASGKGVSMRALWVVTENAGGDVNVTVGNFMGYDSDFILNVSGSINTLNVENGKTGSSLFSSPPNEFELRLNFNTTEKNLLLEKRKSNLYLILEMGKGFEKIAGEMKA